MRDVPVSLVFLPPQTETEETTESTTEPKRIQETEVRQEQEEWILSGSRICYAGPRKTESKGETNIEMKEEETERDKSYVKYYTKATEDLIAMDSEEKPKMGDTNNSEEVKDPNNYRRELSETNKRLDEKIEAIGQRLCRCMKICKKLLLERLGIRKIRRSK